MYSDLHWLLWDTLLLPDVHSRLFHWVGQKKNMAFLFCDMAYCEQEQTVCHLCWLLNKRSDLPHKQGCKIQANQSIRGTKKFRGGWKNRKCVQILTDDFWQSSAHTDWQFWEWHLQWNTGKASVGIGSWHWVIVWLPQPLKIFYWPFQTWSISSNLNYVGRPTLEKYGSIWLTLDLSFPL